MSTFGENDDVIGDGADKKKVSDAISFGPRFCQLFEAYSSEYGLSVNLSRHLMSLCIEHLVTFINWIRDSEQQSQWVSDVLFKFDYLRPAVRNGIVAILVYTFASIKATRDQSLDMFMILQHNDSGLGIANRISLKIYSDPFLYFSFLKTSVSALIDAGVIPENEKVNQPKKSRIQTENKTELQAFNEIKNQLIFYLDSGDNTSARNLVQHATNFWQTKGKAIRKKRFSYLLESLRPHKPVGNTTTVYAIQQQDETLQTRGFVTDEISHEISKLFSFSEDDSHVTTTAVGMSTRYHLDNDSDSQQLQTNKRLHHQYCDDMTYQSASGGGNHIHKKCSTLDNNTSTSSPNHIAEQSTNGRSSPTDSSLNETLSTDNNLNKFTPVDARQQGNDLLQHSKELDVLPSFSAVLSDPFTTVRCERVGPSEWLLHVHQVYDLDNFMFTLRQLRSDTYICLVNESALRNELDEARLSSGSTKRGVVSLSNELHLRSALVTSWLHKDLSQFCHFLSTWNSLTRTHTHGTLCGEPTISLYEFWKSGHSSNGGGVNDMSLVREGEQMNEKVHGIIMYEVDVSVGIVVRACPTLNLLSDVACILYPCDLQAATATQTFGEFLFSLFPQLHAHNVNSKIIGNNNSDYIVKLCQHERDTSNNSHNPESYPLIAPPGSYFTVGALSTPATRIIARLGSGPLFCDFMLEPLS